jgi:hypothetical protein
MINTVFLIKYKINIMYECLILDKYNIDKCKHNTRNLYFFNHAQTPFGIEQFLKNSSIILKFHSQHV